MWDTMREWANAAVAAVGSAAADSADGAASATGPQSAPAGKPYLYLDNCLRNARDHARTKFRADGNAGSSTAGAYWPCTVTDAQRPGADEAPWFLNLLEDPEVCRQEWRSQYAAAYRGEWDRYRAAMTIHCPADGHIPSASEQLEHDEVDIDAIEAAAEGNGPPVVLPAE